MITLRQNDAHPQDQGFAAVDALVALMILSATIILSLAAAQTARRAAAEAAETRAAHQALAGLLLTTSHDIGQVEGHNAAFSWQITTAPSSTDVRWPTSQICIRSVVAQASKSRRRYRMDTAEICPAPRPS